MKSKHPPGPLREPNHLIWDDRLTETDKNLVAQLNESLDRFNVGRAVEINVSGPFARSKIAWKQTAMEDWNGETRPKQALDGQAPQRLGKLTEIETPNF